MLVLWKETMGMSTVGEGSSIAVTYLTVPPEAILHGMGISHSHCSIAPIIGLPVQTTVEVVVWGSRCRVWMGAGISCSTGEQLSLKLTPGGTLGKSHRTTKHSWLRCLTTWEAANSCQAFAALFARGTATVIGGAARTARRVWAFHSHSPSILARWPKSHQQCFSLQVWVFKLLPDKVWPCH